MKKGDKVWCKRTYTKKMLLFLEGASYEISGIDSDNFILIYSSTTDTIISCSNNFFKKYFKTVKEIRREKLKKLEVI